MDLLINITVPVVYVSRGNSAAYNRSFLLPHAVCALSCCVFALETTSTTSDNNCRRVIWVLFHFLGHPSEARGKIENNECAACVSEFSEGIERRVSDLTGAGG